MKNNTQEESENTQGKVYQSSFPFARKYVILIVATKW